MRVALVNNGTKPSPHIHALLEGSLIDDYYAENATDVLEKEYDLIILSGSSRFPIAYSPDHVASELTLIQKTDTPLIGICYGAELLAVAYGGTLKDSGHSDKGVYSIQASVNDPIFLNQNTFDVYEAHRWSVDCVPAEIEVLAQSARGPEIIRHRFKPQYGFQFHPEKMCDQTYGDELFRLVVAAITKHSSE